MGRLLPLTHGVIAARRIAAGASLSSVSDLVAREVAIGAAYFALAYLLFRFFKEQGRRSATPGDSLACPGLRILRISSAPK